MKERAGSREEMEISVRNEKQASSRESKACDEMERMEENARPEETQTSMLNQSKRDVLGGDGQNAWLNIYMLTLRS